MLHLLVAKLTDFGLARDFSNDTVNTDNCGTDHYMAPKLEDQDFERMTKLIT